MNAVVAGQDPALARSLAFRNGRVVQDAADPFRIDLAGHVVVPGLINAHDHLQLNTVPRIPHAAHFGNSYEWIEMVEAHSGNAGLTAAVGMPATLRHWHGGLKNILSGATTVVHHDPLDDIPDDAFPVHVPRRFGWAHSLGLGLGEPPRYGPHVVESFANTPADAPWIIHLAEGVDEIAGSELRELDALGCLASNTVLVHGVGLGAADIELILERGASVVWCPASNLELFGATLDPGPFAAAGCLAIGTDARLTGSRDLLDELRIASRHAPLSSAALLRMVTTDAARIHHLGDRGGLAVGMQADCVILRGDDEPAAALLRASRADLRAVVRGGKPVLADPDFADWFLAAGVDVVPVRLDGREKLLARSVARADAIALEPGLDLIAPDC